MNEHMGGRLLLLLLLLRRHLRWRPHLRSDRGRVLGARAVARLRGLLLATVQASVMAIALAGSGCALTGDRVQQLQQDGVFVYPAAARAARTTGEVRVRFDITADGQVENARVVSAAPPGLFDVAALTYVQGRRYLPARRDGEAVPVAGVIARIRFDLGDVDAYPAGPSPDQKP